LIKRWYKPTGREMSLEDLRLSETFTVEAVTGWELEEQDTAISPHLKKMTTDLIATIMVDNFGCECAWMKSATANADSHKAYYITAFNAGLGLTDKVLCLAL
jgi:hypothetical protein